MRFINRLSGYAIMQAFSLIVSLLATIIVIRGIGATKYGDYAFYVAVGEGFKAIILLGYEQSIGHYSDKRTLNTIYQHDSLIFNSKLFIFIILFPFLYLIDNGVLKIAILLMMLSSVIDVSYLHMEHSQLERISQTLFISRLVYLLAVFILINTDSYFEVYVLAFGFTNLFYSIIILCLNKRLSSFRINLVDGAKQFFEALPLGANRIFLFNEGLLILYFFKRILTSEVYGIFMLIFNIGKMLTAFLSVSINPVFKNVIKKNTTKILAYKQLFLLGFLATCALIFTINFLAPIHLVKKIIGLGVDDQVLILWLMYSTIYAFALYISTIYLTIGIIAFGKAVRFYFTRILYVVIVIFCGYFFAENNPIYSIFILICGEIISVLAPSLALWALRERIKGIR